jgi:hypothetical protein
MRTNKLSIAIATTALLVAVFGSTPLGHAAGRLILPRASVGTPQLKAGAVTGLKVKDGSLAAADFAAGQLPAGPKGDKGDTGPKGDRGDQGLTGYQVVTGKTIGLNPGQIATAVAACPAGKKAIGGSFSSDSSLIRLEESSPTGSLDGWLVTARNDSIAPVQLIARAVCAYVG